MPSSSIAICSLRASETTGVPSLCCHRCLKKQCQDEADAVDALRSPVGESELTAPVTEIATFYHNEKPLAESLDRFREFLAAASGESSARPVASAVGITYEEVECEDVNGNAVVLIVGWESIETHEKFRGSKTYKQYMPKLREGVEKVHVHHVAFRKIRLGLFFEVLTWCTRNSRRR